MEVLGEGSFGCVVKPVAKCTSSRKRISKNVEGKSEVGKIFVDRKDFEKELEAAKIVADIDPSGKTILVPTEHCKARVDDYVAMQCEAFQGNNNRNGYQILMPYGGVRLDDYVRAREGGIATKEFVTLMLPVAEGIVKMEHHKYCHQDIKVANILVTPQHRAIIIDYSLMVPFKDIYKQQNMHYLHHTYFSYPPEYKSVYYANSNNDIIETEILRNVATYDNGRFIKRFKKTWGNKNWVYNDIKQLQHYVNTIDVYSLGTVFVRLTPFISDKHGKLRVALEALIDRMIEIDPSKRITPTELVTAMKNIIDM